MATTYAPVSPQAARPERPRAVSSMSYASTAKSHKSSRSKEEKKLDLTESARDKRRLEGKADPTKALHEAQPTVVAQEDASLDNIRLFQHKDREGNVITDPDRSNPTRPRMERPLDTIRAFAAAAEGTTSRRSSYQRPSSQYGQQTSEHRRPPSHYGPPPSRQGRGGPQGGYYSRQQPQHNFQRQDSFAEDGGPIPPQGNQRQYSYGRPQAAYPYAEASPDNIHRQQQSYETMTSGSDELSKSTNPSSQNSSFDQLHQMSQRKPDEYNHNPYRQGPPRNHYPPNAFQNYNQQPSGPTDDYGIEFQPAAPPPPPKHGYATGVREVRPGQMMKTNSNTRQEMPNKRQSWIKRTFSKRG